MREGASSRLLVKEEPVSKSEAAALEATSGGAVSNQRRCLLCSASALLCNALLCSDMPRPARLYYELR